MHIAPRVSLRIEQIFSCVCAGRAQMVKEQSRLEKLLLQQQRENRTLQRTYEITKAGIYWVICLLPIKASCSKCQRTGNLSCHTLTYVKPVSSSMRSWVNQYISNQQFHILVLSSPDPKKNNIPRCHVKSPTAHDMFWPIPGLISCAGVTRRWGLPSYACKNGDCHFMHARMFTVSIVNCPQSW